MCVLVCCHFSTVSAWQLCIKLVSGVTVAHFVCCRLLLEHLSVLCEGQACAVASLALQAISARLSGIGYACIHVCLPFHEPLAWYWLFLVGSRGIGR